MFLTMVRDVKDMHMYYLEERFLWPYCYHNIVQWKFKQINKKIDR